MCSSDNKMGNNNVLNSNNRGTHTLIGDMRMQVGNKFSNLQISEAISTFFRKTLLENTFSVLSASLNGSDLFFEESFYLVIE